MVVHELAKFSFDNFSDGILVSSVPPSWCMLKQMTVTMFYFNQYMGWCFEKKI